LKKNPAAVLLTALGQDRLVAGVAEALPGVAMQYGHRTSNWLVEQARKFNLQNRLGFVVNLALQVAERATGHDNTKVQSLRELRSKFDRGRLHLAEHGLEERGKNYGSLRVKSIGI
jgi:hypothetical protein